MVIQESVDVQGWSKGARAEPSAVLRVTLALQERNRDKLSEQVLAVSTPSSPRYGQHLSPAEIAELTAPSPQARAAVSDWLSAAGIAHAVSRYGDRIDLSSSVDKLERLFATQFHKFHRDSAMVLQAGDLHAPVDVAAHIDCVFGVHGTPFRRPAAPVSMGADPKITPSVLRQAYNVSGVTINRAGKNKQAVVEFQGQVIDPSDVDAFFRANVPDAQVGDSNFTCVGDTCTGVRPGTEASLDIQYLMGLTPGIKTEAWNFNSPQFCADVKNWTAMVIDHDDPPLVFSISYGVQGNVSLDKRQGCNEAIVKNIETDFAKIAARGITLIFSSGDDGAGGEAIFRAPLWPVWPGSAPHSTAVGATQFVGGDLARGEEMAVTGWGSGGGFSWRWTIEEWQRDTVAKYLADPEAKLPTNFNKGGRATPDVSAVGKNYQVILHGKTMGIGGTSASAPFFASLVSLLNEYRLQSGKSPLGYLNPLIYQVGAKAFRDVTVGDNKKDRSGVPTREGFTCTRGWDAVTGFGTPNFASLLEVVKALPSGSRRPSGDAIVV